ncbi:MAG: WG repeat-containing protein [Cyclobacteriaceae bacterium]
MRILISYLSIVFLCYSTIGADFSVFEKDGRFGIKDGAGAVTIPAVYEKLGWSTGDQVVYEGVIGFRRDGLWGLVSIKNKILTENKFYTLSTFDDGLLLASIKGRFSNHLFHGILNPDGEVKISFNYFGLKRLENSFVATEFDQYRLKVGLLSGENTVLIPIKYKSITSVNNWFVAERFDQRKDVYLGDQLITQNLDSVRSSIGFVAFKNGLAGYFDKKGVQKYPFEFKNIQVTDGKVQTDNFPFWEVFEKESKVLEKNCDSLSVDDGLWTMHLNGAKHKVFPTDQFKVPTKYELQEVVNDNLIVRHIKTGKWSVLDYSGKSIVQDQDSIFASGSHYIVKYDGKWNLYNGFGTKVNRLPLQSLKTGVGNHFMAQRNNYWGVIDFSGKTYINFKYDSLDIAGDLYIAKFHSKWGILDKHGNWKIYPEFAEFRVYQELIVGRKGAAYSYFNRDQLLYKTTFHIEGQLGSSFIIKDEEEHLGLLAPSGTIISYPSFTSIKRIGDYFVLSDSSFTNLADIEGKVLVSGEQAYEDFGEVGEDYISARRNGRWGFVDSQGRLRVSNRYENVQAFQEDYAAIKLRGRWGFIDKSETLKVQPHYEEVSSFRKGLAIVKENEHFGIIDKDGEEIIAAIYQDIGRSANGNYYLTNDQGLIGLADENGSFILRANFASLLDLKDEILVKVNGKMGVLDYQGNQKFKISYSAITEQKGYLLLRR